MKGSENLVPDHLSGIFTECTDDLVEFSNRFPNEKLFPMSHAPLHWFTDIVKYLATGKIPPYWFEQENDRFFS